jgi:hypothetical protein
MFAGVVNPRVCKFDGCPGRSFRAMMELAADAIGA